jgi:hypothetical protein
MTESIIYHVVIAPPFTIGSDSVEQMASVLGQDLYRTRLQLSGKIPKIISQCKTAQAAESIVQKIDNLGIRAFICNDSELRKPPQTIFIGRSLTKTGTGIIFTDKS